MPNKLDQFTTYTPTRYYPAQSKYLAAWEIRDLMSKYISTRGKENLKINLNIAFPFCSSHCFYCFCNTRKSSPGLLEKYNQFLVDNLIYFAKLSANLKFNDLLIGCGSVNLLSEKQLDLFLNSIFTNYQFIDRNKTVEVFPDENLTLGKLQILSDYGINKISLGVETFNRQILTKANRLYKSPQEIKEIIDRIHQAKISNINLDFIMGLAEQDITGVLQDLGAAVRLKPAQIVLYTLQPTKAYVTLFFQNKDKFYEHLQQFTSQLAMVNKFMQQANYSNYAPNELVNVYYNNKQQEQLQPFYFDCPYWGQYQPQQADFSVGQYAHSYLAGQCFFTNILQTNDYQFKEADKYFEVKEFSPPDLILDFVLGYWGRNMALPLSEYQQYFSQDLLKQFPLINKLIDHQVLFRQGDLLSFNHNLGCKARLLHLLNIFPRLND